MTDVITHVNLCKEVREEHVAEVNEATKSLLLSGTGYDKWKDYSKDTLDWSWGNINGK